MHCVDTIEQLECPGGDGLGTVPSAGCRLHCAGTAEQSMNCHSITTWCIQRSTHLLAVPFWGVAAVAASQPWCTALLFVNVQSMRLLETVASVLFWSNQEISLRLGMATEMSRALVVSPFTLYSCSKHREIALCLLKSHKRGLLLPLFASGMLQVLF